MSARPRVPETTGWPPYGTLALRLDLGIDFVAHALDKLLLISLPGIVEFFEAHGFPGWTAYPVFCRGAHRRDLAGARPAGPA